MSGDVWDLPPRSSAATWGWRVLMVVSLAVIGVIVFAAVGLMRLAPPPTPPSGAPLDASAVGQAVPTPAPGGASPQTQNAPQASTSRVDATWAADVSSATGIPVRAVVAYAAADLVVDAESPACGIGWNTLAGIGAIESDHGRHGGAVLSATGYPEPAIRGLALNGDGVAAIADTDAGAWDGDTVWDRAVGPMQFIPDTWERWGADGDGDGSADPNQIDDAALAAARYLCASGPMTSAAGWRAAIFSYNHLDSYVDDVAAVANRYAEDAA